MIERTSYIWYKLFTENQIPADGTIIEVAPGREPKIGNALRLMGFHGIVYLIDPDQGAAHEIEGAYRQILPRATIKLIIKRLQDAEVGVVLPFGADALVASHPFDDMVIDFGGDYALGIKNTVMIWNKFIDDAKPAHFIASQYPSRTLAVKRLFQRQNSGFAVLYELKNFYKKSSLEFHLEKEHGFKGDPKWWICAKNPKQI